VPGQGVEEGLVGGRVGQREVVDGVDDADAEVMAPDAVDETAREEGVLGTSHPREEGFTGILARLDLDRGTAQRPGDGCALPDRLALRGDRLGTYEDLT